MRDASTYLERIVSAVRRRVNERRARLPQVELEALSAPGRRPSFATAVDAPGISLIAEIKRASPSRGSIRPGLDVAEIAEEYEMAGARGISVLTEEDFFLGSLADLRVASACTGLPLLLKDFVIDSYQIHEARAFGASAVLLIAALLDDRELRHFAGLANDLGLDVLLEVHDATEMTRALAVDRAVIGVNNRDLGTFTVSLDVTAQLAGLVPPGRLLVSESGIRAHEDVEWLASLGVDGVLVGESILDKPDLGKAISTLMGPPPAVGAARPAGGAIGEEAG